MDVVDRNLKLQLDRCRVPHYTGPFTFSHSGRGYWIVTGPVPLRVAEELYKDPAANHIRVAGHCGCPPPEPPWTTLRMHDGTELLPLDSKAKLEATQHIASEEFYSEYMKKFTFSDDPEVRSKARCYVETYHIDSEVGLRVFVDHLRWYNLL